MTGLLFFAAIILSLSLGIGLARLFRGPFTEDRMMSAQLVGTTGVGLVIVIGKLLEMPASVDVALIMALLAAVSVAALTRRRTLEEPYDD